jgi:hypothetical protein
VVAAALAIPATAASPNDCVVIDTDFDIDDMMSIPTVLGARHVAAIVTTEGYTLPELGAAAVTRLVAEPGQRAVPVIVGAGVDRPEPDIAQTFGDYVLVYRGIMNRLKTSCPPHCRPRPEETTTCSRSPTRSPAASRLMCWSSGRSPRS